ncbi:hypothetical protein K439DRAFT_1409374 [Ramaria rubella]|nr:hypothetical protein K439DRAFT_1409374 [Ramaria rubella]
MSKHNPTPPGLGPVPSLIQFLESVPPPVTQLLVELAPVISHLRWAAEVVSWRSHWTESWLVVAGWWILCLGTNAALRHVHIYLFPMLLLLPTLLSYLPPRRAPPPTTEHVLTNSLSDITTLKTLLPCLDLTALPAMPFYAALRVSVILYIPYTLTTYFVPMPILLGIAGTILLTFRAPWACTVRTVLSRSAYVQRFLLWSWTFLSGIPPPPVVQFSTVTPSPSSVSKMAGPSAPAASPPMRFLFTILECQRWWMGLDWTAALLPGERPSWCAVSHQPVSPPSAFSLPPPTSIFLAAPNGRRIKRTATWRWEESEWGILINKDNAGVKRVERKPPGIEDEEGGSRIASKAATMLKERAASMGPASEQTTSKDERDASARPHVGHVTEPTGEDLATDVDGWIYGDNKWEGTSAKGGMGKYTRYRRWTRIAVLEEEVEEVGPGKLGILTDAGTLAKSTNNIAPEQLEEENVPSDGETKGTKKAPETPKKGHARQDSHPQQNNRGSFEEQGSGLRERLKNVVKGSKGSP